MFLYYNKNDFLTLAACNVDFPLEAAAVPVVVDDIELIERDQPDEVKVFPKKEEAEDPDLQTEEEVMIEKVLLPPSHKLVSFSCF